MSETSQRRELSFVSARETAFQVALRNFSKLFLQGEELGNVGVLQQRAGTWEHQRILLIKETGYVKGFGAFLWLKEGRARAA